MTMTATSRLASWALAGVIALSATASFAQAPRTTLRGGNVSNFGTAPANVRGGLGATPDAAASNVDNYINQDDQLNLDANTGNVRVLRTNEKAALNDYVTATFPINNATPRELRNVFRSILSIEGGTAEVIRDRNTGDNMLQVIAPSFTMPYIQRALPTLDESWIREYDTGSADVYYKAVNRRVADVDVFASRFASSDNGFSAVDFTANAVSRIDEPYRIESYEKGAKMVDIPANQVLLDVAIYEVTASNDLKLGLDYIAWKNGPGRNLWNFIYSALDAQSNNDNTGSIFDPFASGHPLLGTVAGNTNVKLYNDVDQYYRAVNYLLPSNFIDFLQVKGDARVINKQQLQVKSANTATISADDQLLALVSQPSDLDNVDADTRQGIVEIQVERPGHGNVPFHDTDRTLNYTNAGSTGVSLTVTPFVGLESMELVVSVEVGDLTGIAPNGTPIIGTRTLDTTVRLMDGQEYVVAHLKRTNNIEEAAKAPFFGDIPVLGYLFGGETQTNRESDLLVVITPHFHLSSQTDLGLTADAQSTKDIVVGDASYSAPDRVPYGYDQWMLGVEAPWVE
jgi:type II secretory pathway component GspD/PulD (secretin)